jgi:hypothetical protein
MMIEVKVQCDCGTKYKFDVEPLDGRLPSRVHCPGCGIEGTDAANALLRQKLAPPAASPSKTAPIPKAAASSLPGPKAVPLVVEPVPARGTAGLKSASASAGPATRGRFAMGAVGAVMAGLLATLAWFFLIKVTGYPLGFAAWGVGLLVGLGARGLAREGSRRLGWVAAACAFAAILAGQWLAAQANGGTMATLVANGNGVGILSLLWLLLAAATAWKLGASGAKGLRSV